MPKMGRANTFEGVLNKQIEPGRLIPINKARVRFYCPNCYSYQLYYTEIETNIFDVTCLNCNKHWTKSRKSREIGKKPLTKEKI